LIMSRSFLLSMRNVSGRSCRGNQNTHFIVNNFFPKIVPCITVWKNIVEPGRPQMTKWRTPIPCWISKATHTHTHTHRICNTYSFYIATMDHERASLLRLYVHCLLVVHTVHSCVTLLGDVVLPVQ